MTRADIFIGLLLATGFGTMLWEASSFQYATDLAPGTGFAPVWLAIIGIVLSLSVSALALRLTQQGKVPSQSVAGGVDRGGLVRVAMTLIALAVTVTLVPWLGLVLAILVFLLFLTLGVQRLRLLSGLAASGATVTFIYLLFVQFLGVPIPTGPLGF